MACQHVQKCWWHTLASCTFLGEHTRANNSKAALLFNITKIPFHVSCLHWFYLNFRPNLGLYEAKSIYHKGIKPPTDLLPINKWSHTILITGLTNWTKRSRHPSSTNYVHRTLSATTPLYVLNLQIVALTLAQSVVLICHIATNINDWTELWRTQLSFCAEWKGKDLSHHCSQACVFK